MPWEGFHFIDLIFPLFLFMIGTAIPFSMAKRLARGDSRTRIYGHLLLRVAILIVLGMMVNGSLLTYDPKQFQLTYSVLQMLALGYLVASLLFLHLRLRWQVVATAVMLVGYWALLALVPGPGHEIGKFREGCNAGDWITEFLVGKWRGYQVGWIVGVLGHASTAMLGVFAGQLLRSPQSDGRKLTGWRLGTELPVRGLCVERLVRPALGRGGRGDELSIGRSGSRSSRIAGPAPLPCTRGAGVSCSWLCST